MSALRGGEGTATAGRCAMLGGFRGFGTRLFTEYPNADASRASNLLDWRPTVSTCPSEMGTLLAQQQDLSDIVSIKAIFPALFPDDKNVATTLAARSCDSRRLSET
jgi:hypothetical protein